jgi:hypothetical protein
VVCAAGGDPRINLAEAYREAGAPERLVPECMN